MGFGGLTCQYPNLACSQSIQNALAKFLSQGDYKKHLTHKKKNLEMQRNQLIHSLRKHWPPSIKFSIPKGGLSVWIELEQNVDTHTLYNHAIEKGIVIAPGTLFSIEAYFRNFIRLSFRHPTIDLRDGAIKTLSGLMKKTLNGN